MKYQALASKGGDQAIVITGGKEPLIIYTNEHNLASLQSKARQLNTILAELQEPVASTKEEPPKRAPEGFLANARK
jgi:hypothetical protein